MLRVRVEIGFITSWSSRSVMPTNEYKTSIIERCFMMIRRISLGMSSRFSRCSLGMSIFTAVRSMNDLLIHMCISMLVVAVEDNNEEETSVRKRLALMKRQRKSNNGQRLICPCRSMFVGQNSLPMSDLGGTSKHFSLSFQWPEWTGRMNKHRYCSFSSSIGFFRRYVTAFWIPSSELRSDLDFLLS